MTADSYPLWAFKRTAGDRFGADEGRTVEWAMEFVLEKMPEDELKRRRIDFSSFQRSQGKAPVLPHPGGRGPASLKRLLETTFGEERKAGRNGA